jgi:signal transduction histidine kinase
MQRVHNTFYWGLGGNLLILLFLMALHLLHIPDDLNNTIYDFVSRHSPPSILSEQRSLVIECRPEQSELSDDIWLNFIQELENNGARQIIFLFFPEGAGDKFYSNISDNKNIFFGTQTIPKIREQESNLSPIPPAAQKYLLQSGPDDIPPPRKGVYRTHYSTVTSADGQRLSHIIRQAVERIQGVSYSGDDDFIINFNGRPVHSQPRMTLSYALAGNMVTSLVGGRTVLVGIQETEPFYGLRTPLAGDSQLISPVMYSAYAYDSLVQEKTIRHAGSFLTFYILIIFIVAGTIISQYLKAGFAFFSAVAAFLLTALVTWSSLSFFLIQIPVAELLTGQFLSLLLVIIGKSLLTDDKIRIVAFNTRLQVQERLMPASIYDTPQYWTQIVGMVSQVLNLDRSIFLEKVPGDHRVREVAAANTSIDDILERRRDFERTPYTTALEANGVIEVFKYLKPAETDEHQFLVPFRVTEDDILGFWACSISADRDQALKEILPLINTFATQISEMLYGRKRWLQEQQHLQNPLRKLLTLEGGEGQFDEINKAFSLLTRRLGTVETVFDSLGTGAILYDLFGQVVYANQKITSLCRELDVSPYKYSGAELIVLLTGRNLDEVRQILADLIFTGEKVNYPTGKLGEGQETYMLTVAAVSASEGQSDDSADQSEHAFNILGLLLEIHEMSDVEKLMNVKDVFFNLSSQTFRNYQISFPPVLEILKQEDLNLRTRTKLLTFLETRLASLFDYITRLSDLMTQNLLNTSTTHFPTDCEECLQAAIKNLSTKAASGKVEITLRAPDYMVPVLAIPDELEKIFINLITYLLNDAEPNSKLVITIGREYKFLICHFKNTGYGMPDQDFQKYLSEEDAILSKEFQTLHAAGKQIRRFGGLFSGKSELGKGTEFIVKLKKYE